MFPLNQQRESVRAEILKEEDEEDEQWVLIKWNEIVRSSLWLPAEAVCSSCSRGGNFMFPSSVVPEECSCIVSATSRFLSASLWLLFGLRGGNGSCFFYCSPRTGRHGHFLSSQVLVQHGGAVPVVLLLDVHVQYTDHNTVTMVTWTSGLKVSPPPVWMNLVDSLKEEKKKNLDYITE